MAQVSKPVEQLLVELHQGDMLTRSNAARELGKSHDSRAIEALLPDLNDKDWRVRRNAAQALGALKAKSAVEPLIQALNDRTMTVRTRAAVALGRIKDPRAIPALVEALKDREGDVVMSAAQALKKFGKTVLPGLAAALPASSGAFRLELLHLMVAIPGADVVDALLETLKDPDPMVRAQVLSLIGKTCDHRALDAIQAHFTDPNPYVQACAISALGQMRDSQGIEILLRQLTDHQMYGPRNEIYRRVTGAMQTIAGLPGEFAGVLKHQLAAMAGVLSDEQRLDLNLLMSQYAVMLKKMTSVDNNHAEAKQTGAYQQMMDLFDQVRGAGNTATRQVDDLMGLLSHSRPLTRIAAALSLVWYMDPRALQPLSILKMDPDPQVHAAAEWAYETLRITLAYRDQLRSGIH